MDFAWVKLLSFLDCVSFILVIWAAILLIWFFVLDTSKPEHVVFYAGFSIVYTFVTALFAFCLQVQQFLEKNRASLLVPDSPVHQVVILSDLSNTTRSQSLNTFDTLDISANLVDNNVVDISNNLPSEV
jgi:ABC-type multidrug transport system fused ATPase/permease subunit